LPEIGRHGNIVAVASNIETDRARRALASWPRAKIILFRYGDVMKTGIPRLAAAGAAALLFAFAAPGARALEISYDFAGDVASVSAALTSLAGATSFSGSYSFESTTGPTGGSDSDFAVYNALTAFSVTLFDAGMAPIYTASRGPGAALPEIQVDDAPLAPGDRYGVLARASEGLVGPDADGQSLVFASFRLDDGSDTVFSDALILPLALDLADFDSSAFFVVFSFDSSVVGTLTSLTRTPPSAIPLPAAAPLLAMGIGAFGLFARRRRRAGG
jgi:hypothetical protein